MQFWPPDDEHMCSKHVEAWNKTYCETKILCIKLVNYGDKNLPFRRMSTDSKAMKLKVLKNYTCSSLSTFSFLHQAPGYISLIWLCIEA